MPEPMSDDRLAEIQEEIDLGTGFLSDQTVTELMAEVERLRALHEIDRTTLDRAADDLKRVRAVREAAVSEAKREREAHDQTAAELKQAEAEREEARAEAERLRQVCHAEYQARAVARGELVDLAARTALNRTSDEAERLRALLVEVLDLRQHGDTHAGWGDLDRRIEHAVRAGERETEGEGAPR